MTIRKLTLVFVYTALLGMMAGCASFDRVAVTKFEPTRTDANAQFFKFTAFADAAYPLTSEEAERTRIDWLETWLRDNNYDAKRYEVISRVPVLRKKGVFGDIYDIFYEIRIAK